MNGKYLTLDANGDKVEEQAIQSSAGSADAEKLVRLNSQGMVDGSMLPGVEGALFTASEDLDAGDLINIWDDAGTPSIRKADASGSKPADGFIVNSAMTGESITAYGEGKLTGLSGLTVGVDYFLSDSTAGDVTDTPITTSGYLLQRIGRASSTSTLIFERGEPIKRA